jgi:twinkle protein
LAVAKRFGVRVGVSSTDGETIISHFYPKTVDGELTGYKVRSLEPKYFYSVGSGRNSDLFGMNQARMGDVYSGKLFVFEDELSAMSGFQVLTDSTKSQYSPAVVALPDGAGSAAAVLQRNQIFIDSYEEMVVCMDNDEAGESAVRVIRALYPHIKIARIMKGKTKDGGNRDIKDANDLLMEGRGLELNNALRYSAATETPSAAVSVSDCIEDALRKPE